MILKRLWVITTDNDQRIRVLAEDSKSAVDQAQRVIDQETFVGNLAIVKTEFVMEVWVEEV